MNRPEIESQNLSRICNEMLILSALAGGEKHGYQLAVDIEEKSDGFFRFNHGTLYPILHKLEKEKLIEGVWMRESPKRKRKRYALTPKGRRYRKALLEGWREFARRFSEMIGGKGG